MFTLAAAGCGDNTIPAVSIQGSVSGLEGDGLVLLNEGGDALPIAENGEFTFATPLAPGATYAVSVGSQPSEPTQTCLVANGSGSVGDEHLTDGVTDIVVTCTTGTFTVGGTVSGLTGAGLVLQNNGTDDLAIAADGSFAFPALLASGTAFAVTVQAQPSGPTQTCEVSGAAGIVGAGAVTTVVVDCAIDRFTVGGLATGVAGTVVLQNNAGDDITLSATGAFAFPTTLASGATYDVAVLTQPATPSQTCSVTSGTGAVTDADITSVRLDCATNTFTIGGTVTGLAGTGLVLQNNAGDNLAIAADGTFAFSAPIASGAPYEITVLGQPADPTQVCTLTNPAGTVGGAAITDIAVTCATTSFAIGGTVAGLTGAGLVLQNNAGDDLAISADGTFTFSAPLASGASYAVTVAAQPAGPVQTCTIAGGTGTVGAGAVTSVAINCATDTFAVGGTIAGLAGTVVLQNNGGDALTLTANGSFAFASPVASGSAYAVTVLGAPTAPSQTCTVSSGTGTVTATAIASVVVTCVTNQFTVGGTVTGLAGTGLTLHNNGGDALAITANGSFAFATTVPSTGTYAVTVAAQPTGPTQSCVVASASGVIGGAAVTDVSVTCTTSTFALGGTVSGLAGAGLVLRNAGGDDLAVSANGTFAFATPVASGASYAVTVAAQPSGPTQTCVVTAGTGTVTSAAITSVVVTCTTNTYSVGGTVTGLAGAGLVLRNNGGDDLALAADGSFTFATAIASGAPFAVTVQAQPATPTQTCTVTGGTGTIGGANVTSVVVACATDRFTVSGTISGLAATVVLQNNGGDDLTVTANGTFAFPITVASGAPYAVTVRTQPSAPTQTCVVTAGTGTVTSADITSVALSCTTDRFTVGGTVTGAATAGTLVLRNNGADALTVTDGSFTFPVTVPSGAPYVVTADTSGSAISQTCTVTAGSGTIGGAAITTVAVSCTTDTFSIGGTVSGLAGAGLELHNNGGDALAIAADGAFAFTTPIASGSAYAVIVLASPTGPSQTCVVGAGTGTVSGAAITDVTITCATDAFTIGGTVTGLTGTGLVVRNSGGDDLAIAANGGFAFPTPVASGDAYAVTVLASPTGPSQTCAVGAGAGTVGGAAVTSVTITCATDTFTIGGAVTGLTSAGLVLHNSGGDALTITADGDFTFATPVASGAAYAVTIATQPEVGSCSVEEGSGTVGGGVVATVVVTCGVPVTIASGSAHTCEIRTDGTLWCWGTNYTGQLGLGDTTARSAPVQVGTNTTWAALAASSNHTCALQTDASLWCWGHGGSGQLGLGTPTQQLAPVQLGTASWATITTGANHTCGTQLDGTLWCWGGNWNKQLGLGHMTQQNAPVQVGTDTTWAKASGGNSHTCATRDDRSLWCWGSNWSGQLGVGDTTERTTPSQVGAAMDWLALDAASSSTCATQTDGTLWCWGANYSGTLGLGDTMARNVPTQVGTATTWRTVQGGNEQTCGLQADGTLWCWGRNERGQLGVGDLLPRSTPTQIGAAAWAGIAAGGHHTCAQAVTGAVSCWGDNAEGRLGLGMTAEKLEPTQAGTGLDWLAVTSSYSHSCAVRTDGTLWCWGANYSGQLGLGTLDSHQDPAQVGTLTTWTSVAAGDNSTCATQLDDSLWCWGNNGNGQLGLGDTLPYSTPTRVGTATWATVAVQGSMACGTQTDGTLWCWGYNGSGQLGLGDTVSRSTPTQVGIATWTTVATGNSHACGEQADKTLWCWGANWTGQLGLGDTSNRSVPTQVGVATTWAGLTASDQHTCALQAGTLWCWGANWDGQLGVPGTSHSTPIQVDAGTTWATVDTGSSHTCAVKTDDSLWCWGANWEAQLGLGDKMSRPAPTQVGATMSWATLGLGGGHTCATQTDDSLWCWGGNWEGQLGNGDTWRVSPTPQ